MQSPRRSCINCHFLMKGSQNYNQLIWPHERDSIRQGDFSFAGELAISCYKQVWDQGLSIGSPSLEETILTTNRKNSCYFFPFSDGTTFPSADDLLHQKQEGRNRRYKVIALLIAGGAFIGDIIVRLIQMLEKS